MPDDSSYTSGQRTPRSHVSQHTSSHSTPIRSEHTPAQVPLPPPAAASGGFPALPTPAAPAPLRVVVADDNPVVRAGLQVLLSGREDIAVVAEAADGRQAYEMAQQHRPDVVLLDVRMPGVDGISALPHLVRIAPVMMLTYSRESEIVQEALRLGAGATWSTGSSARTNSSTPCGTQGRAGPTSRPPPPTPCWPICGANPRRRSRIRYRRGWGRRSPPVLRMEGVRVLRRPPMVRMHTLKRREWIRTGVPTPVTCPAPMYQTHCSRCMTLRVCNRMWESLRKRGMQRATTRLSRRDPGRSSG